MIFHTVSIVLKHYIPGLDRDMTINTGDFILLIKKWFDIMNLSNMYSEILTKKTIWLTSRSIKNISQKIIQMFSSMRVLNKF